MTIKPEVLAAMDQLDDLANAGEWLTSDDIDAAKMIRAEFLAMDARLMEAVRCRKAIISQCMITEAVTPDLDRPYETISRVIDYYIAMHNSAREVRE